MKKFILLIFTMCCQLLGANDYLESPITVSPNRPKNGIYAGDLCQPKGPKPKPKIPRHIPPHKIMQPYLIPEKHPMKPVLDRLFADPWVLKNNKTLKKAGFSILFSQKRSRIRVVRHRRLPGYLLKIFPLSEKKLSSTAWKRFTTRCKIAKKIREIIKTYSIRHFIVPQKWLYCLKKPNRDTGKRVGPVILLVQDMRIYDRKQTSRIWRTKADHTVIEELHQILKRGYGSAFLSGNVPYTSSKKFAFIDTEFEKRKIPLHHVDRFLSPRMRAYWVQLRTAAPGDD